MKINEKIKFIREMKGWSQKEMVEKLNMSTNGYAGNVIKNISSISSFYSWVRN